MYALVLESIQFTGQMFAISIASWMKNVVSITVSSFTVLKPLKPFYNVVFKSNSAVTPLASLNILNATLVNFLECASLRCLTLKQSTCLLYFRARKIRTQLQAVSRCQQKKIRITEEIRIRFRAGDNEVQKDIGAFRSPITSGKTAPGCLL